MRKASLEIKMLVESLQLQLVGAKAEVDEWKDKLTAEQGRRYSAEQQSKKDETFAEEKAAQFAELKKRLHASEVECSRLSGYMQRVREDDNVADPLVEVEDGNGKRQVSKRFPSNSHMQNSMMGGCSTTYETDDYGRRVKREHWTSY